MKAPDNFTTTEKTFYKYAYQFNLIHVKDATEATAHQAGLDEVERQRNLRKIHSKPQKMVNLSTGEKFRGNF